MLRSEISSLYKWDLTKIYQSDADFYKELESVTNDLDKYDSYYDIMDSSKRLLEFMSFDESISRKIEKL